MGLSLFFFFLPEAKKITIAESILKGYKGKNKLCSIYILCIMAITHIYHF